MSQQPIGKFYDNLNISFPLGNVQCHALKFSYEPHMRNFPKHSHSSNSWEIHYIAHGTGHIVLDGHSYDIGTNSFFINGPHIEHAQFSDASNPITEYCIYLKFDSKSKKLQHSSNPAFLNHFFDITSFCGYDTQNIYGLMQHLFYELDTEDTGFLTQITALLTQLLVLSVRNCYHTHEDSSYFHPVTPDDKKYLIIEECFLYEYKELTLETLSERLGVSPRQTERLLKKHYGKTFLQKKQEAKMSAATVLLRDSLNSITDISVSLGYSSVEHFSSAFHKYYGLSAREWRKRNCL
ncbi:MAG: AraC family transcriptional regulator [Ruminococcus sp.]|nr:AraC family transcriptional regulator [Ruminococcus sp.]